VLCALIGACGSRAEGLDPSTLPENIRADYAIFARRCSRCHSLARPLGAGIKDDEQWVLYVNRMRRQPASGISYEDQKHILAFLRWHAHELRNREAAKDPHDAGQPSSTVVEQQPSPSPSPATPVPTDLPSPSGDR
jgi:hypothetical protein